MKHTEEIITVLHTVGKLKEMNRAGWVLKNVPNPESVADHSFRMAMMALLLANKAGLDKNKCVQMALIHDINESIAGDITPHDKISEEEKHRIEKQAMESLFENTDGTEIINLWEEYEARETPESQFVFELDKIEMLMQAFEYEQKYKNQEIYIDKKIDLSEFWPYVEQRVRHPLLVEMIEILKKKRNKE